MGRLSPRLQTEIAALTLVLAGMALCAATVVDAHQHGRSVWGVHLAAGGAVVGFGLGMLGALLVPDVRRRRARRRRTLHAGRTRELASMSQALRFLRLVGRSIPDDAARVLVGHDRPGLAALQGLLVPRFVRDPNLLVDWVEAGQPVSLYALALVAAIEDADLRAHLSGECLLDRLLLEQRAANIRAASFVQPR
jgi:hypothetical protein